MRQPSIHITQRQLQKILESIGDRIRQLSDENLAKEILKRGKTYSLVNRNILATNDRVEKKTVKLIKSKREDAIVFAELLLLIRRKRKHRSVKLIKAGDKNWGMIKEITGNALEFNEQFGFKRKEGFSNYIDIALDKMQKFGLPKIIGMDEAISITAEAMIAIADDKQPHLTQQLVEIYDSKIIEKIGSSFNYESMPDKFQYFIKAKDEALSMRLSVEKYMKAQFYGFEWKSGIPDPIQLTGIKAKERVQKYLIYLKEGSPGEDFKPTFRE